MKNLKNLLIFCSGILFIMGCYILYDGVKELAQLLEILGLEYFELVSFSSGMQTILWPISGLIVILAGMVANSKTVLDIFED